MAAVGLGLLWGNVSSASPPQTSEAATKRYLGAVEAGGHVAFVVSPTKRSIELIELADNAIGSAAEQAVGRAPAWLREHLREALRRMDSSVREAYARAINDATAATVDEIAFVVAHLSPEDTKNTTAAVIQRNAELIYEVAASLKYVELVEHGTPDQDDDYYTTARYHLLRQGSPATFEAPRDIYYWWVVHPLLDVELVTTIDPGTGTGAAPPQGVFWRDFFLAQPGPSTHYVLAGPNSITDASLASASFGAARAHGSLAPSLVGTNELIRVTGTDEPVLVHFSPSKGTCNASYPMPDGIYLATTIPLEQAAASGQDDLLENVLLAGPGRTTMRDHDIVVQTPQTKEPRKYLVVRDRAPFGLSPDPNETVLADNSRSYDVMTSAQLATLVDDGKLLGTDTGVMCDTSLPCPTGEKCVGSRCLKAPFINHTYNKIVIPSDQPHALYEVLAQRREELEAFVKHSGVLELHGATRESDDWSDLTLPGGLRTTPQVPANHAQQIHVYGNARLQDVMKDVEYLWDGVRRCSRFAKETCPDGDRVMGPDDDAIDRIGWWAGQMLDRSVVEYRCLRGVGNPERSAYPQRIVRNHYGNCGEIQDVVGAASRSVLVPSMLTLSLEDHVWNEFYAGDDQWYPYDTGWSDTPMRVGEWGVSGDGDSGGGKENAVMLGWRGDGQMVNLLGRYEAQWVDGKIDYEYTRYLDIEVTVRDANNRGVDGALVTLLTESYYSAASAVKAIFGVTDGDGKVTLRVGAQPRWGSGSGGGPRTFYVNVASALGHWPRKLDLTTYSPPADQFEPLVTNAEAVADSVVNKEIVLDGKDDDGNPYRTIAFPAATQETWSDPAADSPHFRLALGLEGVTEIRPGRNPMHGRSFFETLAGGNVDVYITDRASYDSFAAGKDFRAGLVREAAETVTGLELPIPDASKEWVVVLSNARRAGFLQQVQAEVKLLEVLPGTGDDPDSPDSGGCSCAVATGSTSSPLPWLLLGFLLAWRVRRR